MYLFRGKRVDNGELVVGSLVKCPEGVCISNVIQWASDIGEEVAILLEVIPETVSQCTGLSDKNGKLGYAGDDITWTDPRSEVVFRGVIVWDNDCARFAVKSRDNDYGEVSFYYVEEFEIIGNIHTE
jgi:hypothetical protein